MLNHNRFGIRMAGTCIQGAIMKNGALFLCLSCAIALVALACGEDKPVTPPATPPLKYQIESEQIAVYTAGTLRPGDSLTRQIDRELDLIRST